MGSPFERLRPLALDSSVLIDIANDTFSSNSSRRARASEFQQRLLETASVIYVCWHHLEEILGCGNDTKVDQTLQFLRMQPQISWVRAKADDLLPGSILDILVYEVDAVFNSGLGDAKAVRDEVSKSITCFGSGDHLIGDLAQNWQSLRPYVLQRANRAREIVAISRARYIDLSKEKVVDILSRRIRSPEAAQGKLEEMREGLAKEVKARGDKKISDPHAVAKSFFDTVVRDGSVFFEGNENPALEFLKSRDIEESEITPDMTMAEVFDIATFRQQLRVANKILQFPWAVLRSAVHQDSVPSWIVTNGIRKYGQDLPERKGSDLTDGYLGCLAVYANVTYVDKRTMENIVRAKRNSKNFKNLLGRIEKVGDYQKIGEHLKQI